MRLNESFQTVLNELGSDVERGLSSTTYEANLKTYGLNQLPAAKKQHPIVLFFKSLIEPLALMLLVVAIISAAIGEYKEMGVIFGIVLINAAIGTFQEVKARQSIDALKKLSSPQTTIRRNGQIMEVATDSLVPGDIVLLEAGKFVPADLRIIEAAQVQIDESALTGESLPVSKSNLAINAKNDEPLAIGDQLNMAFMSTFLTKGRLIGVVVNTGLKTEMGKIAALLANTPEKKTPLQKKLGRLVLILAVFSLLVGIALFGWRMGLGDAATTALIAAIALAVAVVPESLPLIVSVILAFGVNRMAKQNAIVKKLPVVEVLGAVNVICSDKTGTLTQNRMSVVKYWADGNLVDSNALKDNSATSHFIKAMALCNDAVVDANGKALGDPTEFAFVDYLKTHNFNINQLRQSNVRVDEAPFDSERKLMTTVHGTPKHYFVYTKGALDVLISRCTHILINNKIQPIKAWKEPLLKAAEVMAGDALRVLGFAYKEVSALTSEASAYENNLILLATTGMIDPVRPEVAAAIRDASAAGVRTVMITGDHRNTAGAIARNLKMIDNDSQIITGAELDLLSSQALQASINDYRVFSRVSPEHKVRIVDALKAEGLVVAMTGDGVNDGPSLARADVGVAMGITGTDVAKQAAGMILTDDNFSTIVAAVNEGRNIYQKIKRAITFVLSTNFSELLAIIIVLAVTGFSMLSSIQVLWINLLVESIIAIPLGLDISDRALMKKLPRQARESLQKGMLWRVIVVALITAGIVLAAYFIGSLQSRQTAQTMSFMTMACAPVLTALALRSETPVLFSKKLFANRKLLFAMLIGLTLNALLIFVPPIASGIGLSVLDGSHIAIAIGLIVVPLLTLEVAKFIAIAFKPLGAKFNWPRFDVQFKSINRR